MSQPLSQSPQPSAVMRAVTQLSDKTNPALALRAWRIEMAKATLRLRAKGAARSAKESASKESASKESTAKGVSK